MTSVLRRAILISLGLLIVPGITLAGEAVNPFVANAQGNDSTPDFVPPPSRPVSPMVHIPAYTPPPTQNGTGQEPSKALSATGFTPVPQRPTKTPFPTSVTNHGNVLPPPLSPGLVQHNRAVSSQLPTVPTSVPTSEPAPAPKQTELGIKDIRGPNLVHSMGTQVYVGPHSTANIVLTVSGFSPNMLVTPFRHPFIFTAQSKNYLQFTVLGSKVFLSITPSFPMGAILTGKQPGDPAISLTFVPKKIPGQNYVIHITGWHPNPPKQSNPLSASSRNQHFLSVMDAAARGEIPSGYARVNRLPPTQVIGQNRYTPIIRYDGSSHTLTEYRLTNISATPEQLVESDFYHPGVVAVSFWPSGKLFGHGTTKLFILSRLSHKAHGDIGFLGKE